MGEEERMKYIETINDVLKRISEQGENVCRISETIHNVMQKNKVILEVCEGARLITLKKPYRILSEEFQYLVDEGRKAGYRIHDYIPDN